jgi:serine/threonine-protein kinase
MDSRTLVSQMQQLGLWPADPATQRTAVALFQQFADVRSFARELLQRNLLTAYQANLLLTGKGRQLLIGPYVILERLGEGGMGQVFKARHQQQQRHVVALKVIRPERVTNATAVARFFREVHAAEKMCHPNIVRAVDADQVQGTYYLAMEYVAGTDLAAYVKHRGPLAIKAACQLLAQAALALQHIHEHGMVHRDIKPGNLMLAMAEQPSPTKSGGVALRTVPAVLKILDLGLARLNENEAPANPAAQLALTHETAVLGTADYISPEQARDSRDVDIRSDIYSLGCTFYFALTGRVPFPGGTAIEKMLHHQLDEPAPLDRFRPDVPPLLAEVLRKMLAKQPAGRYQTPVEIAAAVAPLYSDTGPPPLEIPLSNPELPTLSDLNTNEDPGTAPARRLAPRQQHVWVVALGLGLLAGLIVTALVMVALLAWTL